MDTITRKFPTIARIGLGLVFAALGLNKLVPFLPQPPISGAPAAFFGALFATGCANTGDKAGGGGEPRVLRLANGGLVSAGNGQRRH